MRAEQLPPLATREQLGVALLRFIGQTSAFEAQFKIMRESGQKIPAHLFIPGEGFMTPSAIVAAGRRSINEGLKQIGGIDIGYDDISTGKSATCKLIEWQGNHPQLDGQHLWKAAYPFRGVSDLAMQSTVIHTLIEKFASSEQAPSEVLQGTISDGIIEKPPEPSEGYL